MHAGLLRGLCWVAGVYVRSATSRHKRSMAAVIAEEAFAMEVAWKAGTALLRMLAELAVLHACVFSCAKHTHAASAYPGTIGDSERR